MLEKTWPVGSFQCNCRLLACPETGEAVLVDPGDEADLLIAEISKFKTPSGLPIHVRSLLHTHGHLDHIGATRKVREALGPETKIAIHSGDVPIYQALRMQGQLFGIHYDEPLPVDELLEHEQVLQVGKLKISVIHTPGHSPGSICFRVHEDSALGSHETLLSGDTLFQGSVGRTDLWGADSDTLFRSIRERIFTLDGDTRLCPGHGLDSTVGIEKRQNPFFK